MKGSSRRLPRVGPRDRRGRQRGGGRSLRSCACRQRTWPPRGLLDSREARGANHTNLYRFRKIFCTISEHFRYDLLKSSGAEICSLYEHRLQQLKYLSLSVSISYTEDLLESRAMLQIYLRRVFTRQRLVKFQHRVTARRIYQRNEYGGFDRCNWRQDSR